LDGNEKTNQVDTSTASLNLARRIVGGLDLGAFDPEQEFLYLY
jgi:hypothetical protein